MTHNSNVLIESLQADVRRIILAAEKLRNQPTQTLLQAPAPGQWSVAQILQHLNFYNQHYNNAIENRLHLTQRGPQSSFRSGWLGNYFTKLMQPGSDGQPAKKMKAPANAQPVAQPNAVGTLDAFLHYQHGLLNLLQLSRSTDLGAIRVPTSLSNLLSLKLGDTFRFVIAHEQRHFAQIERVLAVVGKATKPVAVGANEHHLA